MHEPAAARDRARRRLPLRRGEGDAPLPPPLRRCLALALLVPMALLVQRALHSVALERAAAPPERSPSASSTRWSAACRGFLAREEQRPFDHYGASTRPRRAAGAVARSPLADPPALPFVVGYFQIDPDGRVRTCRRTDRREQRGRRRDRHAEPCGRGLLARRARADERLRAGAEAQAAGHDGGARPNARAARRRQAARDDAQGRQARSRRSTRLRSLNKGVERARGAAVEGLQ